MYAFFVSILTLKTKLESYSIGLKKNIISKPDVPGFRSAKEYKQVIGRYVGLMSTVEIRTFGDVYAEEGYRNMMIKLKPEQVEVLCSRDRKMYIQGKFGTGKTILLILKARQMIKKKQSVLMVCGQESGQEIGLLTYLVACVKADMTDEQKVLVHYITNYRELTSLKSFEEYNIFVDECNSSVVSYFMDHCWKNNKLCWLAGRHEPHIKDLNIKHLSKVLRSTDKIKATCDELDTDMLYDFVKLNKFPIIDHSRHTKSKNELLFDESTIWRCHQCWKEFNDILVQFRSILMKAVRHDPQASPNEEVKNTKISKTSTRELKTLVEHQHPLAWSDIAILIPSISVITDEDIEAIYQASKEYEIPLNYYLLKDIEAVKKKAAAHGWTKSDDEDILLGKRKQIVIAHVSQFIGLERKIIIAVGWDNATTKADNVSTNAETVKCEATLSKLDVTSILDDQYLSRLVLSNLEEYRLFSNIVEPRSVLSQLLLQLADSYTDKINNCNNNITCDTINVHMLCSLKLLTIICDVCYFSRHKTEVSQRISVPTENVSEINSREMEVKFAEKLNLPMKLLCSNVFDFTWSNITNSLNVTIKTMTHFLSRGKLADISKDVGKIASFHCAISRSTSEVYIWN